MELSVLILVCIHKSYIVYLEIYVVPIGHGISYFGQGKVMENKCWKREGTLITDSVPWVIEPSLLQAQWSGTLYRTVSDTWCLAAASSGSYLRRDLFQPFLSILSTVDMLCEFVLYKYMIDIDNEIAFTVSGLQGSISICFSVRWIGVLMISWHGMVTGLM